MFMRALRRISPAPLPMSNARSAFSRSFPGMLIYKFYRTARARVHVKHNMLIFEQISASNPKSSTLRSRRPRSPARKPPRRPRPPRCGLPIFGLFATIPLFNADRPVRCRSRIRPRRPPTPGVDHVPNKVRTAETRRWTSLLACRPSLAKILWMCFSTAPSETTSRLAIAEFV